MSWEAQPTADGDGLATSRPGLGLLIKTADCQPVLLAHRSGRHIAALHAAGEATVAIFPARAWPASAPNTDSNPVI